MVLFLLCFVSSVSLVFILNQNIKIIVYYSFIMFSFINPTGVLDAEIFLDCLDSYYVIGH